MGQMETRQQPISTKNTTYPSIRKKTEEKYRQETNIYYDKLLIVEGLLQDEEQQ